MGLCNTPDKTFKLFNAFYRFGYRFRRKEIEKKTRLEKVEDRNREENTATPRG